MTLLKKLSGPHYGANPDNFCHNAKIMTLSMKHFFNVSDLVHLCLLCSSSYQHPVHLNREERLDQNVTVMCHSSDLIF